MTLSACAMLTGTTHRYTCGSEEPLSWSMWALVAGTKGVVSELEVELLCLTDSDCLLPKSYQCSRVWWYVPLQPVTEQVLVWVHSTVLCLLLRHLWHNFESFTKEMRSLRVSHETFCTHKAYATSFVRNP